MLNKLKLPSIKYEIHRGDMIQMYNLMQGVECLNPSNLFEVYPPSTVMMRGHNLNTSKTGLCYNPNISDYSLTMLTLFKSFRIRLWIPVVVSIS